VKLVRSGVVELVRIVLGSWMGGKLVLSPLSFFYVSLNFFSSSNSLFNSQVL
jgi:hypothetical protein